MYPLRRVPVLPLVGIGCAMGAAIWMLGFRHEQRIGPPGTGSSHTASSVTPPPSRIADARTIILSPHAGNDPIDEQIRRMQERIAASPNTEVSLERLGRLFIAKARLSNDAGFYKLAEQSALCLEAAQPGNADALLLRGHALAAMHHFRDAEALARKLVNAREFFLDHALLGDALMEQGRLDEAIVAYQQMADLRPGLETYTRIAHVRWLKGDLDGAIEMMELAIESGSPRAAEPLAWATTRLAAYRLQGGDFAAAHQLSARALELVRDYAPALLMRGRILLAEGKAAEAVGPLEAAVERNPLPEFQWMLSDALRESGEHARAAIVEQQLEARGVSSDPRTFALYLGTRRTSAAKAVRLAEQELEERSDVFTCDALAWAQCALGQISDALANSGRALREGTQDARLFLHAGVIYAAAGQRESALDRLQRADALRAMLMPSERALLSDQLAALQIVSPAAAPSLTATHNTKNNDQTPQ